MDKSKDLCEMAVLSADRVSAFAFDSLGNANSIANKYPSIKYINDIFSNLTGSSKTSTALRSLKNINPDMYVSIRTTMRNAVLGGEPEFHRRADALSRKAKTTADRVSANNQFYVVDYFRKVKRNLRNAGKVTGIQELQGVGDRFFDEFVPEIQDLSHLDNSASDISQGVRMKMISSVDPLFKDMFQTPESMGMIFKTNRPIDITDYNRLINAFGRKDALGVIATSLGFLNRMAGYSMTTKQADDLVEKVRNRTGFGFVARNLARAQKAITYMHLFAAAPLIITQTVAFVAKRSLFESVFSKPRTSPSLVMGELGILSEGIMPGQDISRAEDGLPTIFTKYITYGKEKIAQASSAIMNNGMQAAGDLAMEDAIKKMAFQQAVFAEGWTGVDEFYNAIKSPSVSKEMKNKFIADVSGQAVTFYTNTKGFAPNMAGGRRNRSTESFMTWFGHLSGRGYNVMNGVVFNSTKPFRRVSWNAITKGKIDIDDMAAFATEEFMGTLSSLLYAAQMGNKFDRVNNDGEESKTDKQEFIDLFQSMSYISEGLQGVNSSAQGRFLRNRFKLSGEKDKDGQEIGVDKIAAMAVSNEFLKQFRSLRFIQGAFAAYNDPTNVTFESLMSKFLQDRGDIAATTARALSDQAYTRNGLNFNPSTPYHFLGFLTATNQSEGKQLVRDLKNREKYASNSSFGIIINNNRIARTIKTLSYASLGEKTGVDEVAQKGFENQFTKNIIENNEFNLDMIGEEEVRKDYREYIFNTMIKYKNLQLEEEWMINKMQNGGGLNSKIDSNEQYLVRSIANNLGSVNYSKIQDLIQGAPNKTQAELFKYYGILDAAAQEEGRENRPGASRIINSLIVDKEYKKLAKELNPRGAGDDLTPTEKIAIKEYLIKKHGKIMSITDRQAAIDIYTTYTLDERINPELGSLVRNSYKSDADGKKTKIPDIKRIKFKSQGVEDAVFVKTVGMMRLMQDGEYDSYSMENPFINLGRSSAFMGLPADVRMDYVSELFKSIDTLGMSTIDNANVKIGVLAVNRDLQYKFIDDQEFLNNNREVVGKFARILRDTKTEVRDVMHAFAQQEKARVSEESNSSFTGNGKTAKRRVSANIPSFKKLADYFDANIGPLSKFKNADVKYYKSPEFIQKDNRDFIRNYNEGRIGDQDRTPLGGQAISKALPGGTSGKTAKGKGNTSKLPKPKSGLRGRVKNNKGPKVNSRKSPTNKRRVMNKRVSS